MNGQASDSAARIYRHCSVLDLATSALSGFFGIGSGFLIVARADPRNWHTDPERSDLINSSRSPHSATAASYAFSGLVLTQFPRIDEGRWRNAEGVAL